MRGADGQAQSSPADDPGGASRGMRARNEFTSSATVFFWGKSETPNKGGSSSYFCLTHRIWFEGGPVLENDLPIYLSLLPMHLTICPPCRTEIIAFLASQQGRSELFLLDATEHFVPNTDPNHHVLSHCFGNLWQLSVVFGLCRLESNLKR